MLSLKECERILRENGYVFREGFDMKKVRNLLYQWAELQYENEQRLRRKANEAKESSDDTGSD